MLLSDIYFNYTIFIHNPDLKILSFWKFGLKIFGNSSFLIKIDTDFGFNYGLFHAFFLGVYARAKNYINFFDTKIVFINQLDFILIFIFGEWKEGTLFKSRQQILFLEFLEQAFNKNFWQTGLMIFFV